MKLRARDTVALVVTAISIALLVGVGARAWSVGGQEDDGRPEGLARPTSTPDLRNATTPAETQLRLGAVDPRLSEIVSIVEKGDTQRLFSLVNWTERVCGSAEVPAHCPGAIDGESVDALDVGDVTFFVTAEGLRPSLDVVLKGEPALSFTFAARHRERPSVFYVGFEASAPKGNGVLPVTNADTKLTGILLTLDTSAPSPIVDIEFAGPEFPPSDVVPVERVDDLEIWLYPLANVSAE